MADDGMAAQQLVRVRRELLAACMTCPLCHKLLRDATTVSECLHTFCRKCIFQKLTEEEVDCCPICNIDLGCTPVEKLRPDHSLQDVRAKIFPYKRRKVEALEVLPAISLPIRRKERSLSSLVITTPRIATQKSLTGRRSKMVARRAIALRGLHPVIDKVVKKEDKDGEDHAQNGSLSDNLSKRQSSLYSGPSNHVSHKVTEDGGQSLIDKTDLWKPLNCLVEAANRTKGLKSSPLSPVIKSDMNASELHIYRTKTTEQQCNSQVQDDKWGSIPIDPLITNGRKIHGKSRKRRELKLSAQALVDASSAQNERRMSPVWFSLIACTDSVGDAPLPQIPSYYLRIKDGNLPVSFIQKYLVKKLSLGSEFEVEITCRGQPVSPMIALHNLVDLWLCGGSSQRVQAPIGTSAKDFVMVLSYRKVPAP